MQQSTAPNTQQQQQLDLTTLPLPSLSQLQSRLSSDLTHLSTSHTRLRQAQIQFQSCLHSLSHIPSPTSTTTTSSLLIPLTTSLYVPATPSSRKPNTVLVDVGTGYYIEKNIPDAKVFYEKKVKELDGNLSDIERVVGQKSGDLRSVEDVLRMRVLAEQEAGQGQGHGQQQLGQGKGGKEG